MRMVKSKRIEKIQRIMMTIRRGIEVTERIVMTVTMMRISKTKVTGIEMAGCTTRQ